MKASLLCLLLIISCVSCARAGYGDYIHITRLKIMLLHEGQEERIDRFNYDFEALRSRLEFRINDEGVFSGVLGERYLAMDHELSYFVIKYRYENGVESRFCIFDKDNSEHCDSEWHEMFSFPRVITPVEESDIPWDE